MNKKPDLFEDEKVIRKGGTHPKLTLAALIEKRMQNIKPNREVPLIEHENITRKWSPTRESKCKPSSTPNEEKEGKGEGDREE